MASETKFPDVSPLIAVKLLTHAASLSRGTFVRWIEVFVVLKKITHTRTHICT